MKKFSAERRRSRRGAIKGLVIPLFDAEGSFGISRGVGGWGMGEEMHPEALVVGVVSGYSIFHLMGL